MPTPDPNRLMTRAREGILAAMPDVVAIYVFGSAVTGDFSEGSDLDIAALGPGPYDSTWRSSRASSPATSMTCSSSPSGWPGGSDIIH